jgi:hypothetical protein
MPFVIDGQEYSPHDIPRETQLLVVDKIDVRMDKDLVYKAFIDILKEV